MAVIYVSPTGSDTTGDGSESNPYQHFYKAIDEASSGDTIIAKPGTYHEDEGRVIANKDLTIKSESEDYQDVTIVVDGLASGYYLQALWVLNGNTTLEVRGITFNWGSASHTYGTGFILGNEGSGNCINIIGCFLDGSDWCTNSDHARAIGGRRVQTLRSYKCTFRHMTKGEQTSSGIGVWDQVGNVYVKDCIFEDCHYGIHNAAGTLHEDHNCFYNNTYDLYSGSLDSSDLTSDPKFVSDSSARTQPDSPCRDAGVVVSGYVEDYCGDAPDIGCFERCPVVHEIDETCTLVDKSWRRAPGTRIIGGEGFHMLWDEFGPNPDDPFDNTKTLGQWEDMCVVLSGVPGSYVQEGTFTSGVLDLGQKFRFFRLQWTAVEPTGTEIDTYTGAPKTISVRASDTPPTLDANGEPWSDGDLPSDSDPVWGSAGLTWWEIENGQQVPSELQRRYVQFRATLRQT